jgi:hypothetical protein
MTLCAANTATHCIAIKEKRMDLTKILSDLEAEKNRIVRVIEALAGVDYSKRGVGRAKAIGRPNGSRGRGGITPAGRRRLSLAMKKRWAERKRKMA